MAFFKHLIIPQTGVSRYRASLIHLMISCLIMVAFLVLMFTLWYPGSLFSIDGGAVVLKILIGVDLVLGPLLTLIVFKQGKPGLKLDLSVIAVLQLSALLGGAHVIYTERPVFMVFADNRFFLVSSNDADVSAIKHPEIKYYSKTGPVPVLAGMPRDFNEQVNLMMSQLNGGKPFEQRTENYEPFKPGVNIDLAKKPWPIDKYLVDDRIKAQYRRIMETHQDRSVVFYPIYGRYKSLMAALDAKTGEIIGDLLVDHRPIDGRLAAEKSAKIREQAINNPAENSRVSDNQAGKKPVVSPDGKAQDKSPQMASQLKKPPRKDPLH